MAICSLPHRAADSRPSALDLRPYVVDPDATEALRAMQQGAGGAGGADLAAGGTATGLGGADAGPGGADVGAGGADPVDVELDAGDGPWLLRALGSWPIWLLRVRGPWPSRRWARLPLALWSPPTGSPRPRLQP